MKKVYTYLLCAVSIPLISAGICSAQSTASTALALNAPKGAITVDGSSQDWGDSLSYYNPEKKIHYTLANDKTNLYLVVKTKDPVQQNDILTSGITFSVDTKGRKKSAFSTTFPSGGGPNFSMSGRGEETQQQKALKATLTRIKKIKVDGFKDINDDDISTSNPYAIQVAINYEADGGLVYEEAIPLELFHAGELAKGEWSFNIKLNGIEAASPQSAPDASTSMSSSGGGGGGRGGKGGGGSSGGRPTQTSISGLQPQGVSTPSIDFWGKFSLAKAQ